ncbi:MAG: trehalose-phosphatase [Syntrophotaleaceae bacterium]
MTARASTDELPLALEHIKQMGERVRGRQAVVFIDYDGTLTPIVENPEEARISGEMRQALRDLSEKCTVGIVSGRDLPDVKHQVGIGNLIYAGSHGFDISSSDGNMNYQQGLEYLPDLDRAEQSLRDRLQGIAGCQVERKRFAIAVHFRRAADIHIAEIEARVDEVLEAHPNLRKTGGKKIFELRPNIEWDKGRALSWIMRKLDLDGDDVVPFYIGDDLTDEDAFRELQDRGITILVRDEPRTSNAQYVIDNTEEVRQLLHMLGTFL